MSRKRGVEMSNAKPVVVRKLVAVITTATVAATTMLVAPPATAASPSAGKPDLAFIAKIKANGGVKKAGGPGTVYGSVVQPDGKIVVVGSFDYAGGKQAMNIARFNSDGSIDSVFMTNINLKGVDSDAYAVALAPDGKVVVAGEFSTAGGTTQVGPLTRYLANGLPDSDFNLAIRNGNGPQNGAVKAVAVQSDGKIVIGGDFDAAGGQWTNHVARYNANGVPDNGPGSFNAKMFSNNGGATGTGSNPVRTVSVLKNGNILVGGDFLNLQNQPSDRMGVLTPNGDFVASFTANVKGGRSTQFGVAPKVVASLVQPDGKIVIAGDFSCLAYDVNNPCPTAPQNGIARFAQDGTPDAVFNANVRASGGLISPDNEGAPGSGGSLAIQPNGNIIVGGYFGLKNDSRLSGLARLYANGNMDSEFNANATDNRVCTTGYCVVTVAAGGNDRVYSMGWFDKVGSQTGINGVAAYYGTTVSPTPPKPIVKKPGTPQKLRVTGKSNKSKFKATWTRPKVVNSTYPVSNYWLTVRVKGKSKDLIVKTLRSNAYKYTLTRKALKKALKKYKVKSRSKYKFTVRVYATNKVGKSSGATRSFYMKK